MDTSNLFTAALNLEKPWEVSKVEFIPCEDNPDTMAYLALLPKGK